MTQRIRLWLETPFLSRPVWSWFFIPFAFFLSLIFATLTSFRRRFVFQFARNDLETSFPIVCVGNVAMGGTGKSPFVRFLVRFFLERGFEVALLSRGYGKETKVFFGSGMHGRFSELNDENAEHAAFLKHYEKFYLYQNPNRLESLKSLKEKWHDKKNVIAFLDDGLQNGSTPRTHDICVWDGPTLLSAPRYCLPLGPYREGWGIFFESLFQKFSLHIVTHMPQKSSHMRHEILKNFLPHSNQVIFTQQTPVYFSATNMTELQSMAKSEVAAFLKTQKNPVLVLLGLARPEIFHNRFQEEFSVHFIKHSFADHGGSLADVAAATASFSVVVTSAKDFFRWSTQPEFKHIAVSKVWIVVGLDLELYKADGSHFTESEIRKALLRIRNRKSIARMWLLS